MVQRLIIENSSCSSAPLYRQIDAAVAPPPPSPGHVTVIWRSSNMSEQILSKVRKRDPLSLFRGTDSLWHVSEAPLNLHLSLRELSKPVKRRSAEANTFRKEQLLRARS